MAPPLRTAEFVTSVAPADTRVVGAVAQGDVVARWIRRLQIESDDELRCLRVARSAHALAVLGDAPPWVDGLLYLRPCTSDTSLLLPTTAQLSIPEPLFARALRAAYPQHSGPLAVLPASRELLPLAHALVLTRSSLQEAMS